MNKKIDETYKLRIKFFKKTNMRGFVINNLERRTGGGGGGRNRIL